MDVNVGNPCFDWPTDAAGEKTEDVCGRNVSWPVLPGVRGGETKDDCMGDALRELPGRATVTVLGKAK